MEIFVDFGVFELLAVTGLTALAKAIYRRPLTRWAVLVWSVVAPAVLVILASTEVAPWIAALGLSASLVNCIAIVGATRAGALQLRT